MMINEARNARSKIYELAILMRELNREGALRVNRYRLLNLVDYSNDASGGWARIREAFEDVGGDPEKLRGIKLPYGDVLLLTQEPTRLANW